MKLHMDALQGRPVPEPDEEAQRRMAYGRDNEVHARATLASVVLPVWYPGLSIVEEGAYLLGGKTNIMKVTGYIVIYFL